MTESRLKELQTEIARLEKLDNETTERVNSEFEKHDCPYTTYGEPCQCDSDFINEIEDKSIECSADLDLEMQYESE